MRGVSLLIVDPDVSAANEVKGMLREQDMRVEIAGSGGEALSLMGQKPAQLILAEIALSDMEGIAFVDEVHAKWPLVPIIVVTASQEVAGVVKAMRRGATNYIRKPPTRTELFEALTDAIGSSRPPEGARRFIHAMVGESVVMSKVFELIPVASRSQVNVMVTGETGTGKELVAEAIHQGSERRSRPFIKHNCARTPRDLFESEFFGHRKGAFTGAGEEHVGLLEEADQSHLFLDELEAMSPDHQAKLLRAIDDGEVRPLGARESRKVEVRYISATNRDPWRLVAGGYLRDDLYYRLRGIEIALPPLRNRVEDIPLLARHFLQGASGSLDAAAMEALQSYEWPGNVRQLRNVLLAARDLALVSGSDRIRLEHLAICEEGIGAARIACAGSTLGEERLPAEHVEFIPSQFRSPTGSNGGSSGKGYFVHGTTLAEIERAAILQALQAARGNRSEAARVLGISRTTLRRLLKTHGVKPDA